MARMNTNRCPLCGAFPVSQSDVALFKQLVDALRLVADWRGVYDTDCNETFERIAKRFYDDTGCLRPGKDQPAAKPIDERERRITWERWCLAKNQQVDGMIRAALKAAGVE